MIGDRIRAARIKKNMTLEDVARRAGVTRQTIQKYETGIITNIPSDKIEAIAAALHVTPAYLMGWENDDMPRNAQVISVFISFPVIGSVRAGYGGIAIEEYTGDIERFPIEDLGGRDPENFFVLHVAGNSMWPLILDGDRILVERTSTVDNGSLAVVIYNGEEATIKRIKYGDGFIELIPQNPEFMPRIIKDSAELEECHIIGKVVKLIRKIS